MSEEENLSENENLAKEVKESYDSNNPAHVNVRKAASGRKSKQTRDAYIALSSHQQGRELLWDLLSRCGENQTSFRGEQTHTMAFLEGQRNIGLYIKIQMIKHAPANYAQMMKEHADD